MVSAPVYFKRMSLIDSVGGVCGTIIRSAAIRVMITHLVMCIKVSWTRCSKFKNAITVFLNIYPLIKPLFCVEFNNCTPRCLESWTPFESFNDVAGWHNSVFTLHFDDCRIVWQKNNILPWGRVTEVEYCVGVTCTKMNYFCCSALVLPLSDDGMSCGINFFLVTAGGKRHCCAQHDGDDFDAVMFHISMVLTC